MPDDINNCEHDVLGDERTCFACGRGIATTENGDIDGHWVEIHSYQRRWGSYQQFASDHPASVRPVLPEGDTWYISHCNRCAFVCVSCGTSTLDYDGYNHPEQEDTRICSDCWNDDYTLCAHCDETLHMRRTTRHLRVAHYVDGDYYCEDHIPCEDDEDEWDYYDDDRRSGRDERLPNGRYLILPYGRTDEGDPGWNFTEYVPLSPITSGKYGADGNFEVVSIKRFDLVKRTRIPDKFAALGFELELKMRDTSMRNTAARWLLDGLRDDYIVLKEDGTVNGWEQVTYPADYRAHMELYPWDKLPVLASDYTMYAWNDRDKMCGLHVHISRSAFRPSHLYRFVTFHDKHVNELIKFAGRNNVDYARHGRTSSDDRVGQVMGKTWLGYRSVAVNLTNDKTVELRYFRGSLKPSTVKAAVQFTHALWAWTKDMSSADVRAGALTFDKFMAYASDNIDAYPDLAPRFVERGLLTP